MCWWLMLCVGWFYISVIGKVVECGVLIFLNIYCVVGFDGVKGIGVI